MLSVIITYCYCVRKTVLNTNKFVNFIGQLCFTINNSFQSKTNGCDYPEIIYCRQQRQKGALGSLGMCSIFRHPGVFT